MKFDERVKKARNIAKAQLPKVVSRYSDGRAREVIVPGSNSKQYSVILRRTKKQISGECHLIANHSSVDCQGNSNGICYHVMTAIIASAIESGLNPHFTENIGWAKRLANLKSGRVATIASHQSRKVCYIVFEQKEKSHA